MPSPRSVRLSTWLLVAMPLALLVARPAAAADAPSGPEEKERPVDWARGPGTFDLGDKVAKLALGEDVVLANRDDATRLLKRMDNVPTGRELGLAAGAADGEDWFVIFEYDPIGFVKDDEAHQIDAQALLESIREGTEQGNERRKKSGTPGLHVVGWDQPPRYDPRTNNLSWAIRARSDDGHDVVNHKVRLLGRSGVMSVILVDSPEGMKRSVARLEAMLQGFEFKQGQTYAEWRPGDKVAEYGLTALVAAGAGAAAVKVGLFAALGKFLAKGWKLIALLLAGLAGGLGKLWGKLRGRGNGPANDVSTHQSPPPPPALPSPPEERSGGPGFGDRSSPG
jgi:uncharacterized membrane-anchored protein